MRAPLLVLAACAAIGATTLPEPMHAQTTVDLEVAPFVGGSFFLTDLPNRYHIRRHGQSDLEFEGGQFKDAYTLGTNAGVRIDDRFGIEAFFAWLPTRFEPAGGPTGAVDVNGFMYGLTFLYHFDLGRLQPFLGAGAGGETFDYDALGWDRHTDFMANVVVGTNVAIDSKTAIRLEARDCITWFDPHVVGRSATAENDLMLTVGLDFRIPIFGG